MKKISLERRSSGPEKHPSDHSIYNGYVFTQRSYNLKSLQQRYVVIDTKHRFLSFSRPKKKNLCTRMYYFEEIKCIDFIGTNIGYFSFRCTALKGGKFTCLVEKRVDALDWVRIIRLLLKTPREKNIEFETNVKENILHSNNKTENQEDINVLKKYRKRIQQEQEMKGKENSWKPSLLRRPRLKISQADNKLLRDCGFSYVIQEMFDEETGEVVPQSCLIRLADQAADVITKSFRNYKARKKIKIVCILNMLKIRFRRNLLLQFNRWKYLTWFHRETEKLSVEFVLQVVQKCLNFTLKFLIAQISRIQALWRCVLAMRVVDAFKKEVKRHHLLLLRKYVQLIVKKEDLLEQLKALFLFKRNVLICFCKRFVSALFTQSIDKAKGFLTIMNSSAGLIIRFLRNLKIIAENTRMRRQAKAQRFVHSVLLMFRYRKAQVKKHKATLLIQKAFHNLFSKQMLHRKRVAQANWNYAYRVLVFKRQIFRKKLYYVRRRLNNEIRLVHAGKIISRFFYNLRWRFLLKGARRCALLFQPAFREYLKRKKLRAVFLVCTLQRWLRNCLLNRKKKKQLEFSKTMLRDFYVAGNTSLENIIALSYNTFNMFPVLKIFLKELKDMKEAKGEWRCPHSLEFLFALKVSAQFVHQLGVKNSVLKYSPCKRPFCAQNLLKVNLLCHYQTLYRPQFDVVLFSLIRKSIMKKLSAKMTLLNTGSELISKALTLKTEMHHLSETYNSDIEYYVSNRTYFVENFTPAQISNPVDPRTQLFQTELNYYQNTIELLSQARKQLLVLGKKINELVNRIFNGYESMAGFSYLMSNFFSIWDSQFRERRNLQVRVQPKRAHLLKDISQATNQFDKALVDLICAYVFKSVSSYSNAKTKCNILGSKLISLKNSFLFHREFCYVKKYLARWKKGQSVLLRDLNLQLEYVDSKLGFFTRKLLSYESAILSIKNETKYNLEAQYNDALMEKDCLAIDVEEINALEKTKLINNTVKEFFPQFRSRKESGNKVQKLLEQFSLIGRQLDYLKNETNHFVALDARNLFRVKQLSVAGDRLLRATNCLRNSDLTLEKTKKFKYKKMVCYQFGKCIDKIEVFREALIDGHIELNVFGFVDRVLDFMANILEELSMDTVHLGVNVFRESTPEILNEEDEDEDPSLLILELAGNTISKMKSRATSLFTKAKKISIKGIKDQYFTSVENIIRERQAAVLLQKHIRKYRYWKQVKQEKTLVLQCFVRKYIIAYNANLRNTLSCTVKLYDYNRWCYYYLLKSKTSWEKPDILNGIHIKYGIRSRSRNHIWYTYSLSLLFRSSEEAAITIQCLIRFFLARCRLNKKLFNLYQTYYDENYEQFYYSNVISVLKYVYFNNLGGSFMAASFRV
eukprot:snap_masked-scaffold_19-processed-gene-3.23-mRNA-1 protein AED:1.00 eAED:1.00 QI:0/-1/0/0/-1/1/1/0/1369